MQELRKFFPIFPNLVADEIRFTACYNPTSPHPADLKPQLLQVQIWSAKLSKHSIDM